MTAKVSGFKIDAVLEKIHHQMAAGGHGFKETIFSIANIGEAINVSDISMAIRLPGQTTKHPLQFPEGITILKRSQSIAFKSTPKLVFENPDSEIVLTRIADGMEIARTKVRAILKN